MDTHDLRYYHTPEGLEVLRTKRYGTYIAPFGTYNDEGERYHQVKWRLHQDIFPLLRLIESQIVTEYGVRPFLLSYSGHIHFHSFEMIPLSELESFCLEYLLSHSPDTFEVVLNLNIPKNGIQMDIQFLISLQSAHVQDEMETEEYLVWYLSFGNLQEGFSESLDECYSAEKLNFIISWAVGILRSNIEDSK